MNQIVVNAPNRWRLDTPGASSWPRSARPDAAKKYFMVSADGHANEPANLWVERIDAKYRERLPRVITDKDGVQWRVSEGHRPDRLRLSTLEGEDQLRAKAGADPRGSPRRPRSRRRRCRADLPEQGPRDVGHARRRSSPGACAARTTTGRGSSSAPVNDRLDPAGRASPPADIEGAIAEVQRAAKLGFKGLTLPCKPIWGAHDSDASELQPAGLRSAVGGDLRTPTCRSRSTSRPAAIRAPRAATAARSSTTSSHSLAPTIEPIVNICASGVLERFPKLRFGTIEAGIGWVPWAARRPWTRPTSKHHFWVRPKLQALPSEYFAAHGFASLPGGPGRPRPRRKRTASSTTSCGPTTTRTTRAPGRIRPRRSSAPWASSPTTRAPRSSA